MTLEYKIYNKDNNKLIDTITITHEKAEYDLSIQDYYEESIRYMYLDRRVDITCDVINYA